MSIEQILVVLLYTLNPYGWLIALALALLAGAWVIGRNRKGKRSPLLLPASLILGLIAALAAPALTGSKLTYVTTPTDWAALIGIGVGAAFYCWLLLVPLWRTR